MGLNRRQWLQQLGAAGLVIGAAGSVLASDTRIRKPIPSSGELIPAVGIGTWQRLDVPPGDEVGRQNATQILRAFFKLGGSMVDSSPMYGHAQDAIGQALREIGGEPGLFSATKVWTAGRQAGMAQMEEAFRLWGVDRFDLLQIHNLVDWQTHLPWLQDWKSQGRVRYLGITTSHGQQHAEFSRILRDQPIDFAQFTYSIMNRTAEDRLLPLAAEHGKAVIINRAFEGGGAFRRVSGKPLPDFAQEMDCGSWAQFFLKFVISHPAVTCVIPATDKLHHLEDNMAALKGRLPDAQMREEMIRYFERIT